MKMRYLFIGIALVSLFSACNRDEASLFEKTAAERSVAALDNAQSVLTSATNGWEMIYFANPESRGYNILVQFNEHGKVTATAKNSAVTGNLIETDSSTWVVISDYGPILSFDTYNKILHGWADPRDDGDGLLGDYEFLILHADANSVKLKGKKQSAYCYMFPLKETVDPATYFSEVEANYKKIFANGNLFTWTDGSKSYQLFNGASALGISEGIFCLTNLNGEIGEEADIYPFCQTRTGIQLSAPILATSDTCYAEKNGKLAGETASIQAGPLNTYFHNYVFLANGVWTIDLANLCESVQTAFDAADDQIKTVYKNQKKGGVKGLLFKKQASENILVLGFSYIGSGSKANTFYYRFKMERTSDRLKLTYLEPDDENAGKVLVALPTVETLIKSLEGDYNLQCEEPLNPTLGTKLTDNSNAGLWLKITGTIG